MQPAVTTAEFPQAPGNAIPEEILARWSWGPFLLWLFWVWWNADQRFKIAAVVIFVCNFIPVVNFVSGFAGLAMAIYLGLKGNRIMAANRQFPGGVEQFVAVQTAWARWGIIIICISVVLMVIGFMLMGAALVAGGMNRGS